MQVYFFSFGASSVVFIVGFTCVPTKTLWKYWRSSVETTHWLLHKCKRVKSLQSVHMHSQSQACGLLLHGVSSVSDHLFITNRILSNTLSFLWHYTDFWRKTWTTWQFSLLSFSFSLHLSLQSLVSPSLPLKQTPTHGFQKNYSTACHLVFSSSFWASVFLCPPLPEENQSVHHLTLFPYSFSPLLPQLSSPSLFVYWPLRLVEMITL